MRFSRATVFLAAMVAFAAASILARANRGDQSQAASSNTGLLMGLVIDALDNKSVPSAEVTLAGGTTGANAPKVLTDAEGRFVFLDLPKGTYSITATRLGYADGAYGRRRPGGPGQTLTLADVERIGDLRIPIWKFAAIAGTIRDEAGEPMVDVPVRAMRRAFVAGKRKLVAGGNARTDDRGMYRIGALVPGDYVIVVPATQTTAPVSIVDLYNQARMGGPGVAGREDVLREFSFGGATQAINLIGRAASKLGDLAFVSASGSMRGGATPGPSPDGRIFAYPTQYYPNATTASQAATVTVRSGEERAGVEVQLKLVPTERVSGKVEGPEGPIIATMTLTVDADDFSTDTGLETAVTFSDAAGRFTFLGVPPGQYRLRAVKLHVPPSGAGRGGPPPAARAQAGQPPPPPVRPGYTLWAHEPIAVPAPNIEKLEITMRQGFRISGRVEFDRSATRPEPSVIQRMSVTIDPADARPLVASTIGRGQFDEKGDLWSYQVPPGRYYLRVNTPPPGLTLKSAMWNRQDVSNVAFTLDRDITGIVVSFTERPSTLAGHVVNSANAPDATATVLVFPADSGEWADYGETPRKLRAIRVNRDGRYQTSGLPPGEYCLTAIAEEFAADWQDPKMLASLARLATRVTLAEGESRTLSLKTSVLR